MEIGFMLAGASAEAVAWRLVVARRASVWLVMPVAFAGMALLAAASGRPALSTAVPVGASVAAGLAAGLALYAATRTFLAVVRGWGDLGRDARRLYEHRRALPHVAAVGLGAAMAGGEEMFWRGLFQARVAAGSGRGVAALATWAAFIVVNLSAANVAVTLGAVVGGAVWSALAWWSGGVLASGLCHGLWTALMIAFPPVRG